ncbi:MAG: hypothetical protein ABWY93_35815 [Mycobacterium sp.]
MHSRGQAWRQAIESYPDGARHLAVHTGHLVTTNISDEPHVRELIPLAGPMTLTGTAEELPDKIAALGELGVTEVVYQPAGSDIERELRAFAAVHNP